VTDERPPLRYREISFDPGLRLRLLGAILLTAISGYTAFVVIRALVLAAEGAGVAARCCVASAETAPIGPQRVSPVIGSFFGYSSGFVLRLHNMHYRA
jgi:hypothetical protein